MDEGAAAAIRRRVFGMPAAHRVPFIGQHRPSRGAGHGTASGEGFRFEPARCPFNI
jgi:hypothetical protein